MDIIAEKYLIPFLIACLTAIAPIHTAMIVVGLLIFGDMILGVWAAIKRGEVIRSARLRDTVTKMFVYHTALILGFLVEVHLVQGDLPIAKLTASVIGIVEMKSVFENSSVILGKPLFQEILNKLGSKNR